jgi:hypothetical protein
VIVVLRRFCHGRRRSLFSAGCRRGLKALGMAADIDALSAPDPLA